jgi:hypothetical protein
LIVVKGEERKILHPPEKKEGLLVPDVKVVRDE